MNIEQDWVSAKQEIRKLGIRVTTSMKSCRLGCCVGEHIDEDKPIIWQSANRWRVNQSDLWGFQGKNYWRYLNHDNLTSDQKWEVAKILEKYNVPMDWNFSDTYCIGVDVDLDL